MRATWSVDAACGQAQALDGAAVQQMRLHNLIDVGQRDEAVPDRLGIDDDGYAVLALVEATGGVDAHASAETLFGGRFERLTNLLAALFPATAAGMTWFPLIRAYEDMPLEACHDAS